MSRCRSWDTRIDQSKLHRLKCQEITKLINIHHLGNTNGKKSHLMYVEILNFSLCCNFFVGLNVKFKMWQHCSPRKGRPEILTQRCSIWWPGDDNQLSSSRTAFPTSTVWFGSTTWVRFRKNLFLVSSVTNLAADVSTSHQRYQIFVAKKHDWDCPEVSGKRSCGVTFTNCETQAPSPPPSSSESECAAASWWFL